MISLAGRDILHAWGKFVFTGIGLGLLIGVTLDSALLHLGLFDFGQPRLLVPLWLALLWPLLASTLRHSLAWTAQPWWRASLLGATSAPLSYYAGAQLADVALPYGTVTTLLTLALIWAAVLPLLHRLAHSNHTRP